MAETAKFVTPKGELRWVTITGEGKENMSGKKQYVASLVCNPSDPKVVEFQKSIQDFWEENRPAGKKVPKSTGIYFANPKRDEAGQPIKDDNDKVVYDEEGDISISVHTGVAFPDGSPKKVKVYNAKAKEVNLGNIRIGNGSIGYISGAMGIYETKDPKGKTIDAGVTLYLDNIQIVKLVEFTQDSGFAADEEAEDGWTGEEGWEGEVAEATEEPTKTTVKSGGPRL
ncbi:single-stranded DNA-binding protein [Caudoviricetes sp.]|nr:single-stranded DNA-binding protein [Caudoviricetes sp.]